MAKIPRELMSEGAPESELPPELMAEETMAPTTPEEPAPEAPMTGNTVTVTSEMFPQVAEMQVGDKFVVEVMNVGNDGSVDLGFAEDQAL